MMARIELVAPEDLGEGLSCYRGRTADGVLMLGTFALFFTSLRAAGVDMSGRTPLTELPAGVSGFVGWANRLLFATTYLWTVLASLSVLRAKV